MKGKRWTIQYGLTAIEAERLASLHASSGRDVMVMFRIRPWMRGGHRSRDLAGPLPGALTRAYTVAA